MLRVHVAQVTHNLSDPGMEDALYDIEPVRRFCGFALDAPIPDETSILNFRRRLEEAGLAAELFARINAHLAGRGLRLSKGTIVDALSSTNDRESWRDPEMRSVKKGNDWHFGLKAHVGTNALTGIVHSLVTTAANAHDLNMARFLLTGRERVVWGDSGYQGIEGRELGVEDVSFCIAMRKGKRKLLDKDYPRGIAEKPKSMVRTKVEHPFFDFKRWFGYDKARYRGLYKNTQRLLLLAGLSHLLKTEKLLAARDDPRDHHARSGSWEAIYGAGRGRIGRCRR